MPSAAVDGPAISLQRIAPVEWWKICVEVRGQCVRQIPLEFPKGDCASGLVRERHAERLAVRHAPRRPIPTGQQIRQVKPLVAIQRISSSIARVMMLTPTCSSPSSFSFWSTLEARSSEVLLAERGQLGL